MYTKILLILSCLISASAHAANLSSTITASGSTGGVAVQLGMTPLWQGIDKISNREQWLIYGLDTDAATIDKAKTQIAAKNIYGQISAETYDGANLPFGDTIVNLLIIEDAADVTPTEIERVLTPNGVVMLKSGSKLLKGSTLKLEKTIKGWKKYTKPWPDDIDEWTHFLYNASNNAVSKDRKVGGPNHVQWYAGPEHSRDHDALASMSAMTTAHGRVFYIFDEGETSVIHQPADWKVIARDAFNGKLLWKRDIASWMTHLYNFRAGPVQLPRRLVSVSDKVYVTLGFDAPVVQLNAATGETLQTYKGSGMSEEFIVHEDLLLLVKGDTNVWMENSDLAEGYWTESEKNVREVSKQIMAYDTVSGELQWKLDHKELGRLVPLSLCAKGDRIFYLDDRLIHCVDATSGEEQWTARFETEGYFIRSYAPTVVVYDDVIMCMTTEKLQAFSVATGEKLWEAKGTKGFGSPADLLVIDGKAWVREVVKGKVFDGKKGKAKKVGNAMAIDIHTGKVTVTFPYEANQHHHRCYRNKATENCILIGYSGIQIFDPKVGTTDLNQWVRGICQYGFMPGNGFIYVPPDPCKCQSGTKINGFYALSEKSSIDEIEVKPILEKGPAYARAKALAKKTGMSEAWNTYRGNAERSGGTDTALPEKLSLKWNATIGKSITASVIAENKVYIAERDAYTVYCLDLEDGKEQWRYMANGPVDTPPTIVNGLCVFGSGDGSVYCVSADKGKLVWRFKTSAIERRIGAEDRLESPWRINGAVLVLDGTVYFTAGRSSHLDGGIKVYGLNLITGEQQYFHELISADDESAGSLADILRAGGDGIVMRNATFDLELKEFKGKTSLKGMLDGSWFHRQAGVHGAQQDKRGGIQSSVQNTSSSIGIASPYTGLKHNRKKNPVEWNQVGHLHQKYTRYLQEAWFAIGTSVKGADWKFDEAFQARAMLLAGDRLYMAGWLDDVEIELKTGASKEHERVSVLRVYSTKDGKRLAEYKLESEPVWDSAAAAEGKFFLSLKSGKLLCMGEENIRN